MNNDELNKLFNDIKREGIKIRMYRDAIDIILIIFIIWLLYNCC